MNDLQSYIVTTRNLRIKKKYLHEIFLPFFKKVTGSVSPVQKTYDIAGKTICLNFYSGKLLERMSRAFTHIEKDSKDHPDLTICILDSSSTARRLEVPQIDDEQYTYPREINAKTTNSDSFLGIYLHDEGTLNLYDEESDTAYFWILNADSLPYRLSASPFRLILNWFLSKESVHLMHGAVVSLNGKSILISAKGGTGKSTTALSCFFAGMSYLGDDYVTVKSGDVITTHSIYNSTKLYPQSFYDTFPALKDKIWNENGTDKENEKVTVFLSELFPDKVIKTASLCAIMIPVIKNVEETSIVPAGKIQTMISMVPATLFQLSLLKSDKMAELKSIVERTPCYYVELGSNIKKVGETIKAFISNES